MMLYDITYGIHDHYAQDSGPLDVVAMHPMEQYHYDTALYTTIVRYAVADIKETFGLSLNDYLMLPKHVVDMISHAMPDVERMKQNAIERAKKDAEQQSGDGRSKTGPVKPIG